MKKHKMINKMLKSYILLKYRECDLVSITDLKPHVFEILDLLAKNDIIQRGYGFTGPEHISTYMYSFSVYYKLYNEETVYFLELSATK